MGVPQQVGVVKLGTLESGEKYQTNSVECFRCIYDCFCWSFKKFTMKQVGVVMVGVKKLGVMSNDAHAELTGFGLEQVK